MLCVALEEISPLGSMLIMVTQQELAFDILTLSLSKCSSFYNNVTKCVKLQVK